MRYVRIILSICFSISLTAVIIIFATPIFILYKVPKNEKKIFNFAMELAVRVTNDTINDHYEEIINKSL